MELNMNRVDQNSGSVGREQVRFENAPSLDLSVIIVSWNARDYLLKCLKSLAYAQSKTAMEIIVVDNDSSDGSPEAVERDFPAVRLVRSGGNLGFARANNIGIRMSKGRYLALVNSGGGPGRNWLALNKANGVTLDHSVNCGAGKFGGVD